MRLQQIPLLVLSAVLALDILLEVVSMIDGDTIHNCARIHGSMMLSIGWKSRPLGVLGTWHDEHCNSDQ